MKNEYQNIKILVVDDTAFMRAGLIKILIEMGFSKQHIHQCEDGTLATDYLRKTDIQFNIILSDWNMPNMNGIEFLKLVRSSPGPTASIPFVLITTVSEKDKVIEAIKYKVTGYILKPVARDALEETFERIFGADAD